MKVKMSQDVYIDLDVAHKKSKKENQSIVMTDSCRRRGVNKKKSPAFEGKFEEENHPSFKHRLRENEAELVFQYISYAKSGKISINFDKVDTLLSRFPFFTKYPKQTRQNLLRESKLVKY